MNDRVGALLGSDVDTGIVQFLGYGSRKGERITLDNGGIVYVTECVWASEATINALINRRLAHGFAIEQLEANWRERYRNGGA